MKKEKVTEVMSCDFCKQEKETRLCGGCGADACTSCSTRVDVHISHWQTMERYYAGTTTMGLSNSPAFSGIFCSKCSKCSPESVLVGVGFVKREKAA